MKTRASYALLLLVVILTLPALLIYWDPMGQRSLSESFGIFGYSLTSSNPVIIHPLSLLFEGDRLALEVNFVVLDDYPLAISLSNFFIEVYLLRWNERMDVNVSSSSSLTRGFSSLQQLILSHDTQVNSSLIEEMNFLSEDVIYHQKSQLINGAFTAVKGNPSIPRTAQYLLVLFPSNTSLLNANSTLGVEIDVGLRKMIEPAGYFFLFLSGSISALFLGLLSLIPYFDVSRVRLLISRYKTATRMNSVDEPSSFKSTSSGNIHDSHLARRHPFLAYHWNKLRRHDFQLLALVLVIVNVYVGAFQGLQVFRAHQPPAMSDFFITTTVFAKIASFLVFNPVAIHFLILEGIAVSVFLAEIFHDDLKSDHLIVLYSLPISSRTDWKIRVIFTLFIGTLLMIVPYVIGAAVIFPLRLGLSFPPIDLVVSALLLFMLSLLPLYLLFLLFQYYLQQTSATYLTVTLLIIWWTIANNGNVESIFQLQSISSSAFFLDWSWYVQASYLKDHGVIGVLSEQGFQVSSLSEWMIIGVFLLINVVLFFLTVFFHVIKREIN